MRPLLFGVPPPLATPDPFLEIPPAAIFHLLANRRSERRFSDRPVSQDEVSALLSAAAQTPSGGNARSVLCTVLLDSDIRRRLLGAIGDFYQGLLRIAQLRFVRSFLGMLLGKAAGAFLKDPEYRRRFAALVQGIDNGIDPVFYNAPLVLLFHSGAVMPTPEEDAVLAAYNAAITAVTLGLGTCFVSMAQKAFAASRSVRRASGLAPDQRVLAVLAVGYPEVRRYRPVIRPACPARLIEAGS